MPKFLSPPAHFELEQEGGKPPKKIKNKWTGSITLPDGFTLSQVEAIEAAQDENRVAIKNAVDNKGSISYLTLDKPKLSAILMCVSDWHIENQPTENMIPETFLLSPRRSSHEFINWLWAQVTEVYEAEFEIPNA